MSNDDLANFSNVLISFGLIASILKVKNGF